MPVQETRLEDYEKTVAVTSTSVFLGCKTVAEELFKIGTGAAVVNVSSIMGAVGGKGLIPGYSGTKYSFVMLCF